MIWHASDKECYVAGPYKLYWTISGWSLWDYSQRKACLGRDLTIGDAMALAEKDRNESLRSS